MTKGLITIVVLLTGVYSALLIQVIFKGPGATAALESETQLKTLLAQEKNNTRPSQSLHQAFNQVIERLPEAEKAMISGGLDTLPHLGSPEISANENDWKAMESRIDQIEVQEFEKYILSQFSDSSIGIMLKRIILIHRYPTQVGRDAALEDYYIDELSKNVSHTSDIIAAALKRLPKQEYRDEHVLMWELINKLPEGHTQLQTLLNDEEFL